MRKRSRSSIIKLRFEGRGRLLWNFRNDKITKEIESYQTEVDKAKEEKDQVLDKVKIHRISQYRNVLEGELLKGKKMKDLTI